MTGSIFLFLVLNAFLFSFIFWILTFALKFTYSNKYFNYKLNFYECGFKSLSTVKITYQINYILLILFLIIYDGEFLVLIPFSLNTTIINFITYLILIFFFLWLIIILLIDYNWETLEWQI